MALAAPVRLVALVLLGVLLAAAPGRAGEGHPPARRVVSLVVAATETLFLLGAGETVVGVCRGVRWPEEARRIPVVGGPYGDLNLEMIYGLFPDVVLAYPRLAEILRRRGLPVREIDPNSLEEVADMILMLGKLVGRGRRATPLKDDMLDRIRAVERMVSRAKTRPLVYFEAGTGGRSRGPGSLTHNLIVRAGGENLAGAAKTPFPVIGIETILLRNPDVILVEDHDVPLSRVTGRPGWSRITAVKTGRVYLFPPYLTSYGPRCVDGLEQMARWFHPELYRW